MLSNTLLFMVLLIFVPMTEKHTIKDIAVLAGVSKGTVDRVLHKRGKVSQKALARVNKVLEKIDYQPNLIARNLKNNKTYTFCVLIPDPNIDQYWQPCLEGIEDAIDEYKPFNVFIETFYFDPEKTKSFLAVSEKVITKSPDAVLLVPVFHKETLNVMEKYNKAGILVTTFNNQVKSNIANSFVGQDLIQSGRVAAKLLDALVSEGHLTILHINEVYKNAVHMQEKEKGFKAYFRNVKRPGIKISTCKIKQIGLKASLIKLLEDDPEIKGVFITTSKAYQVAKVLDSLNKDLIMVGYDLLNENLEYLQKGNIDFLIHQNQKMQAYLGITSLFENFLFSKEIPKVRLLPIDIVNSENAKYYLL